MACSRSFLSVVAVSVAANVLDNFSVNFLIIESASLSNESAILGAEKRSLQEVHETGESGEICPKRRPDAHFAGDVGAGGEKE